MFIKVDKSVEAIKEELEKIDTNHLVTINKFFDLQDLIIAYEFLKEQLK